MTAIKQNLDSGRWAVAMVGYRGWRRDAAIGDGITTATHALVTRFKTKAEALALADELNAALPRVLPGSPDVPVYAVMVYSKRAFIARQAWEQNGQRDCDRRVIHQ